MRIMRMEIPMTFTHGILEAQIIELLTHNNPIQTLSE